MIAYLNNPDWCERDSLMKVVNRFNLMCEKDNMCGGYNASLLFHHYLHIPGTLSLSVRKTGIELFGYIITGFCLS